jgi:hypothetical protein
MTFTPERPRALEPPPAGSAMGEQSCPKHPTFAVVGTCTRCGAFICARCCPMLDGATKRLCERCREDETAAARRVEIAGLERTVWLSLVLAGVLVAGLTIIPSTFVFAKATFAGAQWRFTPNALQIGLIGGTLSVTLAGLGIVFKATRRMAIAWAGVAAQAGLLMAYLVIIGFSLSLIPVLLLGVPVWTGRRVRALAQARDAAACAAPSAA